MGGTQSQQQQQQQHPNGNNDNYNNDEGVFVNGNMNKIKDGLSWQPKKEMPLHSSEMTARERERVQEYERKKRNRSARINSVSRQWAASQMANSETPRTGSVVMGGGRAIEEDDDAYQNRWTCCGFFPQHKQIA
jgi:hypothetical protein